MGWELGGTCNKNGLGEFRESLPVTGVLGLRPKLLGSIWEVWPLTPICQTKRQIMVEIRERRFN
jgi:hypothetical protein